MDARFPPIEAEHYVLMTSFSPGSPGDEQELMVDPDGNIIPGSKVLWYTGKLSFDFLADSEDFKDQPLQLLPLGNHLIDCLNQSLCDMSPDILKLENYDATVEEHLSELCSFAREERGFHSPCSLILFMDLMSLDLQNKALFCAETYAVATLMTLNDLPLALVEPDTDLICYITQQATQGVAEIQKQSPAVLKAGLFSKKANAMRHLKNNADKQKAITHFLKNRNEPKYRTKSQAIDTMVELDDFRRYKFSTLQRWFNGL